MNDDDSEIFEAEFSNICTSSFPFFFKGNPLCEVAFVLSSADKIFFHSSTKHILFLILSRALFTFNTSMLSVFWRGSCMILCLMIWKDFNNKTQALHDSIIRTKWKSSTLCSSHLSFPHLSYKFVRLEWITLKRGIPFKMNDKLSTISLYK